MMNHTCLMSDNRNSPWGILIVAHQAALGRFSSLRCAHFSRLAVGTVWQVGVADALVRAVQLALRSAWSEQNCPPLIAEAAHAPPAFAIALHLPHWPPSIQIT